MNGGGERCESLFTADRYGGVCKWSKNGVNQLERPIGTEERARYELLVRKSEPLRTAGMRRVNVVCKRRVVAEWVSVNGR